MNSSTAPVTMDGNRRTDTTPLDAQTMNGVDSNGHDEAALVSKVSGEIQPTTILQAPAPMVILSSATSVNSEATPSSATNSGSPSSASPTPSTPDVDPQIMEALRSKDRIYVLKLGEQMESLIKEKRSRVDLTPTTSYQRLLVHRCSAYYRLAPETDPVTKCIFVQRTPDSRIPERRISELVPPESSSQPAFKIMRRSQGDRRNKPHSQAGSVAGEDGDLSDVEPSEAGSLGGRSSATGGSKKHMTIQEREAAYNEARSRIFMGFEEKEKAKEKDMSASSSSLSLNSASASSVNGDSLGDLDGSVCSPTTESEWSGPSGQYARDRKDHNRRGNSSASSSRSMRSGYHGNHSNPSSRNSRAPSPSFKYASLYEPAPTQQLYDPNQPPNQMNAPYGTQYYHPFAPPPQGYMQPYGHGAYHPYPAYPPPHDPHHPPPPDPSRPAEHYPPPHMGYPYMWHPPNQPPPIQTSSLGQPGPMQPHQAHQGPPHLPASPAQSPVQYPYGQAPAQYPYGAPAGYGHPAQGYYPPPQGQSMMPPPPHPSAQMGIQNHVYDSPQSTIPHHNAQPPLSHASSAPPPHGYTFNPNARSPIGNGPPPPQASPNGRHNARSTVPQPNNGGHGGKGRNNPAIARNPWSYGPGPSAGGYAGPLNGGGGDIVGPRLTSARRQSNLSGGSSRASSYNDDGLSTTSSSTTTSSSSRRTYTSTASSQHPLPPRPDWAVGLKAQPTLARGSHEHTSPRNPISPARNGPVLQPGDFPPLSSGPSPEKRNPVPSGPWGNNANRAILGQPSQTNGTGEGERSLSNPSPKGDKILRRPAGEASPGQVKQGDPQANGDGLATRLQGLSIEETIAAVESRAVQSEALAAAQGNQTSAAV